MSETKWHLRFYKLAKEVATWSKDPEAQVGAVIVSPNRRTFSTGYNGFPHGIHDTEERLTKPEVKLQLIVHAEVNAMDNANQSVEGWSMYTTKACCHRCALAIVGRGIKQVFMPAPDPNSSWSVEQELATNLLTEAGVIIHHIKELKNEQ